MGNAALGARLMAVLSSFGAIVMLAPVASADFAGGGSAKSDCYVVYKGIDSNKVSCTDGDPACDTDGACNNSCTFSLTVCTNGSGCNAVPIDSITVTNASLDTPATPTTASECGDASSVKVDEKQKKNGSFKKGKLKVTVIAQAAAGTKPKKDKDKITFLCLDRPDTDTCPSHGTTTTTLPGGGACCGLPGNTGTTASFMNFSTTNSPGDCGDIINASGTVVANVNCAGLYTGGGGNAVPLPYAVPDMGSEVSAITSCASDVATIGPASSTQTGSNRNCTGTGCVFGAPLAVPNPGSTPTSVCVINALSSDVSGTVNCATGETSIAAPLSSTIFLTGDTATDPTASIAGIQPCPLCSGGTCIGGPNNGMSCTAGTSALTEAYPTSHDCPPDPMTNIGTLPVNFSLSSGTVSWTGTVPTNDTGSTAAAGQTRVFSGFCRDQDGTGAFEGSSPATAHLCWENGMAQGAACSGTFESCVQRNNGAFGPSGGSNRTITVLGTASGNLSAGPAAGTLVSIFSIRPTFTATVDAAGDLPGPGAVALPGTATLCAAANPCP